MPKIQTKPASKKPAPKAKKVTEPKIRTPLDLAIDYYRPYGYSDQAIREHHERSLASGRTSTSHELSLDPIDNVPIGDLLEVERRAALVEKRDPDSITEENVREVAKARRDGKYRSKVTINKETGEKVVKVAPAPEKVENSSGVEVGLLGGRYIIFGHSRKSIVIWCAQQKWSVEEVVKMLETIGVTEINQNTIEFHMGPKAGGSPAELTAEQAALLNKASGRVAAKKSPKPKKK